MPATISSLPLMENLYNVETLFGNGRGPHWFFFFFFFFLASPSWDEIPGMTLRVNEGGNSLLGLHKETIFFRVMVFLYILV